MRTPCSTCGFDEPGQTGSGHGFCNRCFRSLPWRVRNELYIATNEFFAVRANNPDAPASDLDAAWERYENAKKEAIRCLTPSAFH